MLFKQKKSMLASIALVLCACFVLLFLLTSAFVFTGLNHVHDHNGENGGCATCAMLTAAESLLRHLSSSAALTAFAWSGVYYALCSFVFVFVVIATLAPVGLKVRMNN